MYKLVGGGAKGGKQRLGGAGSPLTTCRRTTPAGRRGWSAPRRFSRLGSGDERPRVLEMVCGSGAHVSSLHQVDGVGLVEV